jgi:hypothetical protein
VLENIDFFSWRLALDKYLVKYTDVFILIEDYDFPYLYSIGKYKEQSYIETIFECFFKQILYNDNVNGVVFTGITDITNEVMCWIHPNIINMNEVFGLSNDDISKYFKIEIDRSIVRRYNEINFNTTQNDSKPITSVKDLSPGELMIYEDQIYKEIETKAGGYNSIFNQSLMRDTLAHVTNNLSIS